MRILLSIFAALAAFALAILAGAWFEARGAPVVRTTVVAMPDWPAGAAPITVALISDIHMRSAAMGPERLARIVAQVNALRPDLIVIVGDFIEGEGHDRARRGAPDLAPLAGLRAPLGTIAVLGNHDYGTDPRIVRHALRKAGITVLANSAMKVGPLVVGGIDDQPSGHARIDLTTAAMAVLDGAHVVIAHSPDAAPDLPTEDTLLLAGHTHCGQIIVPFKGAAELVSRFGARYLCGIVREGTRTVVVTAGLGTSEVPLRWGARPDLWLVRLGPL